MTETTYAVPEMTSASPSQPFVLGLLPAKLQEVVIHAVMNTRCERATDIWFQQPGNAVVVLRSGIQWFLNESASTMWLRMDASVRELVEQWEEDTSEDQQREMRARVVDFLLAMAANGLVTLFPEVTEEDRPEKPASRAQRVKKA